MSNSRGSQGRAAPTRGSQAKAAPQNRGSSKANVKTAANRQPAAKPQRGKPGTKKTPAKNYQKAKLTDAQIKRHKRLSDWAGAVFAASVFVLILYITFWPVQYQGSAMEPALRSGDRLFISRAAAMFNNLNHGDIVVYRHVYTDTFGNEHTISAVARIVGMPGDRVSIQNGAVFIDGLPLHEPYIMPHISTHPEMPPRTLSRTEFFLLVDDRFSGGDSREFGVVQRGDITARVLFMQVR
ncbi:MAG: signal peptidase I [Defluviitaleaceae bacterium]|nr:signal peptidase I [Defluviitaleaceae bacterium]